MKSSTKRSALKELFPSELKKSELTQARIIEATIKCFVTNGIENTNYKTIAVHAGLSRSLIQHYFPEHENLILMTVKFVLANFQAFAEQSFVLQPDAGKQFEAFLTSMFEWARKYPLHEKLWLLFYYYSSIRKKFRNLNNEISQAIQQTISVLLSKGKAEGIFKCEDPKVCAKAIQTIMAGALVTLGTEDIESEPFERMIIATCIAIAKGEQKRRSTLGERS